MSIGNRIRELRKKHNFSQEYIAEQLNVSRRAVSKWESGRSNPDTESLIKLAELLNVSVNIFRMVKSIRRLWPQKKRPDEKGSTKSMS
ncbi:hypothetical protein SDC9_50869 [bioreactor metagenome]|uniref:HTH cro/C1-type domain-containing protein n=1 Tax=bioreactor metagenome TaxID=1076179 RepID=A0A644WM12_9ZZZZ